ncbi:small ribosomal subunit protein mS37-like [Rhopilema esculentum]|uniref:small ribosomal subunit protein mS37-like n=1 Tax=Rhopilema esculentum TaxID=499914 RepID=UPI0031E15339
MVNLTNICAGRGQSLIYGVKRGKIPNSLRPRVLPKRREQGQTSCIEEMTRMMGCLKKSKYNDSECSPEIKDFLSCAAKAIERRESGELRQERSTEEINHLLRLYTQMNNRITYKP